MPTVRRKKNIRDNIWRNNGLQAMTNKLILTNLSTKQRRGGRGRENQSVNPPEQHQEWISSNTGEAGGPGRSTCVLHNTWTHSSHASGFWGTTRYCGQKALKLDLKMVVCKGHQGLSQGQDRNWKGGHPRSTHISLPRQKQSPRPKITVT